MVYHMKVSFVLAQYVSFSGWEKENWFLREGNAISKVYGKRNNHLGQNVHVVALLRVLRKLKLDVPIDSRMLLGRPRECRL